METLYNLLNNNNNWLNVNKEVAGVKIVKITYKAHIQNLGKYLDTVKNKWLNKIKEM